LTKLGVIALAGTDNGGTYQYTLSMLQAQPAVLDAALARLETTVASIRHAVAQGDQRALRQLWDSAREWRRAAEHSA